LCASEHFVAKIAGFAELFNTYLTSVSGGKAP